VQRFLTHIHRAGGNSFEKLLEIHGVGAAFIRSLLLHRQQC